MEKELELSVLARIKHFLGLQPPTKRDYDRYELGYHSGP